MSVDEIHQQLITAIEEANAGRWDQAHSIVQKIEHPLAYWIHANLHREEGDSSNAQYWYSRAGKPFATVSLLQEREQIFAAING